MGYRRLGRGRKTRTVHPRERRRVHLRKLGFKSYWEYLHSALWKNIRTRAYMATGEEIAPCRGCGEDAEHLHHVRYDMETLAGRDITWLVALCDPCHLIAHAWNETTREHLIRRHRKTSKAWDLYRVRD